MYPLLPETISFSVIPSDRMQPQKADAPLPNSFHPLSSLTFSSNTSAASTNTQTIDTLETCTASL